MLAAFAQRLRSFRARRCGARAGPPRIRRCRRLSRRGYIHSFRARRCGARTGLPRIGLLSDAAHLSRIASVATTICSRFAVASATKGRLRPLELQQPGRGEAGGGASEGASNVASLRELVAGSGVPCITSEWAFMARTLWPSGLRRWLKVPFRKGVGSNPTRVIFHGHLPGESFCWTEPRVAHVILGLFFRSSQIQDSMLACVFSVAW